MKLCLVMPPPPLKTSGTVVFIAAIAFIGEVAAVVGHHGDIHHVAVHHVPAGVCHHVAIHHVAGHHVALLAGHVGVPVCWRPGCLVVTVTGWHKVIVCLVAQIVG